MRDLRSADSPFEVAPGVYWIGTNSPHEDLLCNPYLVVDSGSAVVIDGGSRSDFPTVMTKILQAGIRPDQIVGLVYQHCDPDLCGSMPNFLSMCRHPELQVMSAADGLPFVSHYLHVSQFDRLTAIEKIDFRFQVGSRLLRFHPTPYAHAAGSFVTHDTSSGVLFTSDLFGCYGRQWGLMTDLCEECVACTSYEACPRGRQCPMPALQDFHRRVMPCNKAVHHALDCVARIPMSMIAPQHGTLFTNSRYFGVILNKLRQINDIGIDGVLVQGESKIL